MALSRMVQILDPLVSRCHNLNNTRHDRVDLLARLTRHLMVRLRTLEIRVPPGVSQDKARSPRAPRLRNQDRLPSQRRRMIPAPFLAWQRSLAGGGAQTIDRVSEATRDTNTKAMVFSAVKGIKATMTAPSMVDPCPISKDFSDLAVARTRTRLDITHQRRVREGRADRGRAVRARLHINQVR